MTVHHQNGLGLLRGGMAACASCPNATGKGAIPIRWQSALDALGDWGDDARVGVAAEHAMGHLEQGNGVKMLVVD